MKRQREEEMEMETGKENSGDGKSIVEHTDGVFHLVANEILNVR